MTTRVTRSTAKKMGMDAEPAKPAEEVKEKVAATKKKTAAKPKAKPAKNDKPSTDKQTKQTEQPLEEEAPNKGDNVTASTIYEFTANDIKGNLVPLDKYKGHVCLIVNVASRCGHTKSNYQQLVELHEKYGDDKGLRILAFPCNQFGSQEPGSEEAICKFADKYNVKFDMFEKIRVNGADEHPLYTFLKKTLPGKTGGKIGWNFTKFIIDAEGKPVERFASAVKPLNLVDSLGKYW